MYHLHITLSNSPLAVSGRGHSARRTRCGAFAVRSAVPVKLAVNATEDLLTGSVYPNLVGYVKPLNELFKIFFREWLTVKHVRTKTSLIFGKILERSHGGQGGRARTVLSKSPPPGKHDTGGAWVFHALLLLWGAGAPSQERLRRGAWSACVL